MPGWGGGGPAAERAWRARLGEIAVGAVSGLGKRMIQRAVGPRLSDAADKAGAGGHDHPGADAVRGAAVDLDSAAESVGTAADDLRRHHGVAERALEVQRLTKARVLLRGGIQLDHLAAERDIGRLH